MGRQYLIPGGVYINETGTKDYDLASTGAYVNETQQAQTQQQQQLMMIGCGF